MTSLSRSFALLALALVAHRASAQSFNVDIGNQAPPFGLPSATYGAGAAQPGVWNDVLPTITVPVPLVDLTGGATPVTLSRSGGVGAFNFNNAGTAGDDQLLMDDGQDLGPSGGGTTTWTFANLAPGPYTLTTYAWAPDNATSLTTVSGGVIDGPQLCGGTWPGAQVLGITFTSHRYSVLAGGSITVTLSVTTGAGSLDGFQLSMPMMPGTEVCFGDGSGTQCPCGNNSPGGENVGCLNSLGVGGRLRATGVASLSADTLVLTGSNMPNSIVLYFQGNALIAGGAGVVFGDGLRCVTGGIVRLGTKTNVGGTSQYPGPGDPPISVQGNIMMPGYKYYQDWYRNPALFCAAGTYNIGNTLCVPINP